MAQNQLSSFRLTHTLMDLASKNGKVQQGKVCEPTYEHINIIIVCANQDVHFTCPSACGAYKTLHRVFERASTLCVMIRIQYNV